MQAFGWICSKRAGSSDVFAVHEQVVRGRAMVSKALQAVRVLGPLSESVRIIRVAWQAPRRVRSARAALTQAADGTGLLEPAGFSESGPTGGVPEPAPRL